MKPDEQIKAYPADTPFQMTRKLEAVSDEKIPPPRVSTERIEIPTGGRTDVDGLIRELCRVAFPRTLGGFSAELDRTGLRCFATVRGTAEQVDQGQQAILRALLALGILKPAKAEEPPPSPPNPEQSQAP